MQNKQNAARPLPLEGAFNVRDLGFYQDCHGRKLQEHRLLRGDSPEHLTDQDIAFLKTYGLIGSVDLRTDEECRKAPSRLKDVPGLFYERVPIQNATCTNGFAGGYPPSLGAYYTDILINQEEKLVRIWRLLARCQEGCVLFHCSAGKDRTGVVAMLVLAAAGVDREVILADYEVSQVNMQAILEQQQKEAEKEGNPKPAYLYESRQRDMSQALKYIEKMFGTGEEYLRALGLTRTEIRRLTGTLGAAALGETA